MFRTVIVLLIAVILVLLMLPVLLVLWIINLVRPELPLNGAFGWIARICLTPLLAIAGVRFEVTGEENLPETVKSQTDSNSGTRIASDAVADTVRKQADSNSGTRIASDAVAAPEDRAAIFVGNHQGGFDAIVPILFLGKPKSTVMKKEIEKVPLAGWALRMFGCIFLDRTDLKAQVNCLREMETMLREGKDIAIFPEGTRSKGPDMGDFKAGAFRSAIAAQVPIVPFVIDGSWHCYEENHRLTPHTVKISILPPFSTEGLTTADAKETAARIRETMQKEQSRLRAEKGKNNA